MGGLSIWHIILLGAVALVLFGGRGKVADLMGDFGKGLKSFKKGLADEDRPEPLAQIPQQSLAAPVVMNDPPVVMNKDTTTHS